ncbi:class I SAM-dependent methyltransferase [Methanosarcina sp. Mfa9]|uniref:class I SAM-dependent methyltransferase n=1 Tax=Methanosarcina sp. Mfa9 TaxID=3439063 RepID=UPI003F83EE5A
MNIDEIDWNEVWKNLYEQNLSRRGKGECASIWESRERALEFLERSNKNPQRVARVFADLGAGPASRILDVGAGPGTLAVPLAARCAHVTAVEPAAGMVEVMKEFAFKEGVENLEVVAKRWEDVDPSELSGLYDVVFASYSLGMPDIRAAVEKMCKLATKRVCLYWFLGSSPWEQWMIDLWPALHGQEYRSGPKADVLFHVLYDMGIYPNMETLQLPHTRVFHDLDAAVEDFKQEYRVETADQEKILREYLSSVLQEEGGEMVLSGNSKRVKLWWEVDQGA